MKTKISMDLEFGVCNGSMTADIYSGPTLIKTIADSIGKIQIEFETELPAQIKIAVSNKDNNLDTVLDDNGNVVKDKYVKLNQLSVGYVPLQPSSLFKICKYTPNSSVERYDTYWGFNGVVIIDISEEDCLKWHLMLDNKFDL